MTNKNTEEKQGELYPKTVPGALVRVHQRISDITRKGQKRDRIQVFEGLVIARKHGSEPGATITVRKESGGIGVEKIFPLRLPTIEQIEVVKQHKTRRAKLNFVRKPRMRRLREKKQHIAESK